MSNKQTIPPELAALIDKGDLVLPTGPTLVHLSRALAALSGHSEPGIRSLDSDAADIAQRVGEFDHYLVILVDGLGMNQVEVLGARSTIATGLNTELRSVFPSTTAAALTSFFSGQWPSVHGIYGWHTHLPDHGITVLPLLSRERRTKKSIKSFSVPFSAVLNVPNLPTGLGRESAVITLRKFRNSNYSNWCADGSEKLMFRKTDKAFKTAAAHMKKRKAPSYTYMYLSEVDHLNHRHGPQSGESAAEIASIDAGIDRLRSELPQNVRIVVTADHGHIHVPKDKVSVLTDDDPLMRRMVVPPSGEARTPVLHALFGEEQELREEFARRHGDHFTLVSTEDIDAIGVYGPPPMSGKLKLRIGSFTAVARDNAAVEYVPEGETPVDFAGRHGGLSPDEMRIPLVLL